MDYKISIIIPIYNVERYVTRCLQSVINQTYTTNVECILVDDCSEDNSKDIAENLIENYKGNISFKIISHTRNKGLSAARNTGIRNASGEYLYFLDSDDEILPEALSVFISFLDKRPNVDCVIGDVYASYPFSKWIRVKLNDELYVQGNKTIQKLMLRRNPFPVTAWNKLIRRDLIINKNLYFAEGYIHEDEIWSFLLSRHITSYGYINYATYVYYQNPNSIISNRLKSVSNKIRILSLFVKDIRKDDLYSRFRLIAEWIFNIYYEISLLDASQRNLVDFDLLYSSLMDFYKLSIKRGYIHIFILLSPYFISKRYSRFRSPTLSKFFSRILRCL